jgi:hypothetical protein
MGRQVTGPSVQSKLGGGHAHTLVEVEIIPETMRGDPHAMRAEDIETVGYQRARWPIVPTLFSSPRILDGFAGDRIRGWAGHA